MGRKKKEVSNQPETTTNEVKKLIQPKQNEYVYSRNATVQVVSYDPQTTFASEKIISNEIISEEDKKALRERVNKQFTEDLKNLYKLKADHNRKGGLLEFPQEENTLSLDTNKIYVPKRCNGLSMKFSRGKFLISVTSIFEYLYPIDFPSEYLNIYGQRGTLVHDTWEHCIKNKVSIMPSELNPELNLEISKNIMTGTIHGKQWSKSISGDECNPAGFLEEYGKDFEFTNLEKDVSNYDLGIYGRYDFDGIYKPINKRVLGDVKTFSPSKDKIEKAFKQMAAYSLCEGNEDIGCLVVVVLNPKSKKGYNAPEVTEDVKKYQDLFLEDLEKFKKEIEVVYV